MLLFLYFFKFACIPFFTVSSLIRLFSWYIPFEKLYGTFIAEEIALPETGKISTHSVSEKAWLHGLRRSDDGYTAYRVLHQSPRLPSLPHLFLHFGVVFSQFPQIHASLPPVASMAELHFVRSCEETAHTPLLRFPHCTDEIAFGINAPLVYTRLAIEQTVFYRTDCSV
jgi:hypothetical protein